MNTIENRKTSVPAFTPALARTPRATQPPAPPRPARTGLASPRANQATDGFEARSTQRDVVALNDGLRTSSVAQSSASTNVFASNDILGRYQSTGASAVTARQDGLSAGVGASNRMADTDRARLLAHKEKLLVAAQRHGVPPAVLAAIASRESRAGAALDSNGLGDHGNGFGLMQVDKRYHRPAGGPYSQEHINQAASILSGYLRDVRDMHPSWPPEQQLRGAIVAYNSGPDNVRTIAGMDRGTTGNDYSNDVWARAVHLSNDFGGRVGSAPNPPPVTNPPTTPPATWTRAPSLFDVRTTPETFLRQGMEGESVRQLQNLLGLPASEQDGKFGERTKQAVMSFQAAHGLTPPPGKEGWVGATTLGRLERAGGPQPTPAPGQWVQAPSLADVRAGNAQLREGMQGDAVRHIQQRLGLEQDGKFGSRTKQAVIAFQQRNGLTPPPGLEGVVGKTTLEKLDSTPSVAVGNVDPNHPTLRRLATGHLINGRDSTCVATTIQNMDRLGVANFPGGTAADPNNPRGAMVRMMREAGWVSVPLPGSRPQTITSPAFGTVTAHVIPADAYERMAQAGKIPSGALIFQTRHGWNYNGGSRGNDMGIVRDNGRVTHNYRPMSPIIYSDAKDVVLLVPRDALR
jgi:peptidoglycan hydrolase-like protein with peptidoglycan-binding domain/soluble lytic murein transglycosylase-like protein